MNKMCAAICALLLFTGCDTRSGDTASTTDQSNTNLEANQLPSPDIQGHRGCRGLMPENTIEGFIKALDLGVNTLEMDVVITADGEVVLSHEPWFSHDICLTPEGNEILPENEKEYRIYGMTYDEVKQYDCGSKPHPRFPEQINAIAYKPLLKEVIAAAEAHARNTNRALPHYNIETKCLPAGDGIMHPKPGEFVERLIEVIKGMNVMNRTIVQSFDIRTLQALQDQYPNLRLALLIENGRSAEENVADLGFYPHIYSPDYHLVDADLVRYCKKHNMQLIPWTVNEPAEMETLLQMGVHGIITDYPDRVPDHS